MATQISNVFIAQFDADVKQAYQAMRRLAGVTREKRGVVGSTHNFPYIGKGLAQKRIPQSDVTPMNVGYTQNTAILEDYTAPEYTDIFNQQKVNFDDRAELVKVVAGAIGRAMDQIVIDAAIAGANSTEVAVSVGAADSSLNVAKLRSASKLMNQNGVPSSDRHMIVNSAALEGLLGDEEATSGDYNTIRLLVNGSIDSYMGFQFHIMADNTEGGLPIVTTSRKCLALHSEALGLAIGMDMTTKIDWVAEKTSWLVNGMFSAGAKVIDDEGVFIVNTYEA